MAYSTPLTAVSNSALTAAQWNASVRDNLLETAPAKATATGRIFVATGANAIAERVPSGAVVTTLETTASTTYANLATAGPAVTVTTGTSALVWINANMTNDTGGGPQSWASYNVSVGTSDASTDNRGVRNQHDTAGRGLRAGAALLHTGLNAASNTFTMQYRVTTGTGSFSLRNIVVIPL